MLLILWLQMLLATETLPVAVKREESSSQYTKVKYEHQRFINDHMQFTLNASGSTSAITIQIIHPAANPVQKGKNLLNASAHRKAGTATMGWYSIQYRQNKNQ